MSLQTVAPRDSARVRLFQFLGPNALPIAIVVLCVVFAIAQPAFLTQDNLIGIVRQVVLVGIMATCTTFVIMTGGVDLSVGPVLAFGGLVAFFCLDAGWPLPLVIVAGTASGFAIGLVSGAIIAFAGLPPIIVTLAALSIVRGSALTIGEGITPVAITIVSDSMVSPSESVIVPDSIWLTFVPTRSFTPRPLSTSAM